MQFEKALYPVNTFEDAHIGTLRRWPHHLPMDGLSSVSSNRASKARALFGRADVIPATARANSYTSKSARSPVSPSEKWGQAPAARLRSVALSFTVDALPSYTRYAWRRLWRVQFVTRSTASPTAVEARTPLGQITSGRGPAFPYKAASRASTASERTPCSAYTAPRETTR